MPKINLGEKHSELFPFFLLFEKVGVILVCNISNVNLLKKKSFFHIFIEYLPNWSSVFVRNITIKDFYDIFIG